MNQIENTLTSLEVAEMVGRRHDHVLADIRQIISDLGEPKSGGSSETIDINTFFVESTYRSAQNKELPCYLVTKQGCEVFGNRMTGAKGTQFTVGYVGRFNQMEQHIKQVQIPTTQRELVQLALSANEETNQRIDVVETKIQEIEENKLITTEDKGTIDSHVRKKVASICRDLRLDQQAKSLLFQDLGSSIKRLFNVPNRGRIKDKDFLKALDFVDTWEPSSVTKAQIHQLSLFDETA
ncbi:Rha family transcriptional regulator [Lactococcus lactis]|uniref:Rha family transcriptional regulator n=1 Tax=Lactococcus lactis TaxID=1358 RepID=UPI00240F7F8B|nr:Rha family transcriptional regulator [Lactococcus lactis]MDM7537502.1 Rha family transcriptional regulator [Lactococcus lactis]MDT2857913.1 Rha family transcriptional regulator [Lactococcus lactis]